MLVDEPPVAEVGDSGGKVVSDRVELERVEERRPADYNEQHQKQRREQAPCPPPPELPEVDPSVSSKLRYEQIGNEIARQNKEHPDAEESTACPSKADVIRNDTEHGNGSNAIESREIGPRALDRLRHRHSFYQVAGAAPTTWARRVSRCPQIAIQQF